MLFDKYELPTILRLLRRYSNIYFLKNWTEKTEHQDLKYLMAALDNLLISSSSAVIVEITNLMLDFPTN